MLAHHYFRDFACMIPWLLIDKRVSRWRRPQGDWVTDCVAAFPSSGEINSTVADAGVAIENFLSAYRADALSLDKTDVVSLAFDDWLNLRLSNTELLLRLDVEGKGNAGALASHVNLIVDMLAGKRG